MEELKILENELVPVYVTSTGEKVVYGTELHAVLEVKSRFNDWIRNRIKDCDAVEKEDFETLTKNLVSGGQIKEHIIKLDTAKEMAMLERNAKGKQVRRYFIEVEKKYKAQFQGGVPRTIPGQIQLLAQGFTELDKKIDGVKQELDEFKKEMPLLGVECQKIVKAKNKKVVPLMGGKEAPAYQDNSLRGKVYRDIDNQLRREFDVDTYKAIKRSQIDLAVKIIDGYELPMSLQQQISNQNSQLSFV